MKDRKLRCERAWNVDFGMNFPGPDDVTLHGFAEANSLGRVGAPRLMNGSSQSARATGLQAYFRRNFFSFANHPRRRTRSGGAESAPQPAAWLAVGYVLHGAWDWLHEAHVVQTKTRTGD